MQIKFLPHREHTLLLLQTQIIECCLGEKNLCSLKQHRRILLEKKVEIFALNLMARAPTAIF